jgi:cobalamin synthase
MNIINAKNSTGFIAGITGLLFALVYVGLEFSQGIPGGISIDGDANTISVWHFPLIGLLAGILFYCVFYAVGTIRGGKVKERAILFSFSVAVAALLALYWLLPMLAGLLQSFGGSGR